MSKLSNENGLSMIELMIVLVTVLVLVGIVGYAYDGIKARSRNDQRTTEIRRLQVFIETFYSQNMYYPSRADLNNPTWDQANLKGFSITYLEDPLWSSKGKECTSSSGQPILLAKSKLGCFGYDPTDNGVSCESDAQSCDKYTLSATLENGAGVYTKYQLD
jgi:type II secretory pathway pseudopilin PulG